MSVLSREDLYPYQEKAVQHIINSPESMMFMEVGLGKTVSTLTAVLELMDTCQIYGTLILAPKLVVQTVWKQETEKWGHTSGLRVSRIIGTPVERLVALRTRADVYVMNYENLEWFADAVRSAYLEQGRPLPFDMIVLDESTRVKNARFSRGGSKRVRALLPLLPYMKRRVALTGTPAPNGLGDLFGQYLCLDMGQRFGTSFSTFQEHYFFPNYGGYSWTIRKGAAQEIYDKVKDITLQMSKADYLQLPPVIEKDVSIPFIEKNQVLYDELEKEFFVKLDETGTEVEAFNAAALASKCLQVSNGACYVGDSSEWSHIHDQKIEALKNMVEENGGQPILVSYNFRHDAARIQAAFPDAVHIKDGDPEEIIDRWNRGEIQMLLGHPRSMGHGLNLQHGGHHLVMFGLNYDAELYEQVVGRLDRPGQTKPVIVTRLMMEGTIEEKVLRLLHGKFKTQNNLKDAMKAYREEKDNAI